MFLPVAIPCWKWFLAWILKSSYFVQSFISTFQNYLVNFFWYLWGETFPITFKIEITSPVKIWQQVWNKVKKWKFSQLILGCGIKIKFRETLIQKLCLNFYAPCPHQILVQTSSAGSATLGDTSWARLIIKLEPRNSVKKKPIYGFILQAGICQIFYFA